MSPKNRTTPPKGKPSADRRQNNGEAEPDEVANQTPTLPISRILGVASDSSKTSQLNGTQDTTYDLIWDTPESSAFPWFFSPSSPLGEIWKSLASSKLDDDDWWQVSNDGNLDDFLEMVAGSTS